MAYNTKNILTDKSGNPISQYFNIEADSYEPVEGFGGGNKVIVYKEDGTESNVSLLPILNKLYQLTGTVIDEETRKSNELQRIALYNQIQLMLNNGELKGDKGDKGNKGDTGAGLQFNWQGTKLGIRIAGDTNPYVYVDLKGEKGDTGVMENLDAKAVEDALGYIPGKVMSVNGKIGVAVVDILDLPSILTDKILIGNNIESTGGSMTALGEGIKSKLASTAVGRGAVTGEYSVALGLGADASGKDSVAVGTQSKATEAESVAIGKSAEGDAASIAIGAKAKAGLGSVVIGGGAEGDGFTSVIVGAGSKGGTNSSILGQGSTGGDSTIIVGKESVGANTSITIGSEAITSGKASVSIGNLVYNLNDTTGILGDDAVMSTNKWIVPGNFTANGTKNFEMPHPKPEKKSTHRIRHGAVESPSAGDTLYRYKITAKKDKDIIKIKLPDYFIHLNKDVQIFVTGQDHFGNGFGNLDIENEELIISCQLLGEYNVLVLGTRNDEHQSVKDWDIKGVEREIGESWTGETLIFEVTDVIETQEFKEDEI